MIRAAFVLPVLLLATACGEEGEVSDGAAAAASAKTAVTVEATDTACTLSATEAPAGSIAFTVTNKGAKTTEFYLYQGDKVLGEVENISAGLTRTLMVNAEEAGSYQTACKPGMTGDGIRGAFAVK
jgi:iron uptake system component EfeO